MINPARLHSDLSRLGRETDMFLATVESLSDDEMAAPSLCEGWTRADVIAHVASSGQALVKLIDWATSGEEQQLYASQEARAREIADLAALPRQELLEELRESAAYFAEQAQRLGGETRRRGSALNGKQSLPRPSWRSGLPRWWCTTMTSTPPGPSRKPTRIRC